MIEKLTGRKTLSAILAVKISAVLLLVGVMADGLYFGDRASRAASDVPAKQVKADGNAPGANGGEAVAAANAEDKPVSAESTGTASEKKPKRKSFLDDLLNLPPIDGEGTKKDEIGRYLALAERKARQVDERVNMLKQREAQLLKLERTIDQKLVKLDEERAFIAQTLQREKDLKGKRIEHLIDLYKKMEPKKAAPLMEKLDKDLVVALFTALPIKQMTSILEGMNPQKSVELTEYYGRVRSGKEYEILKEMNTSLRKEFEDCKGLPATSPVLNQAESAANAESAEISGETVGH